MTLAPAPPARDIDRDGLTARRRAVGRAVAAAVALLAAVLGVSSPAAAQTGPFTDTAQDAYYSGAVGALAGGGVFDGTECAEAMLCPGEPVDRKTMAVWTVRVLDSGDPAPVPDSGFSDVAADSFHGPFIERMAELGVTTGCGDGTKFCPDDTVTRDQMAVFLTRAFNLDPGPAPGFTDVADDAWYYDQVAALAASGITAGCGDGTTFCPSQQTTRAQMAIFLARAAGLIDKPTRPAATPPAIALAFTKFASDDHSKRQVGIIDENGMIRELIDPQDYSIFREWSPDGTRIAYTSRNDFTDDHNLYAGHDLFVINVDGAERRQLTNDGTVAGTIGWSNDGSRIAYIGGNRDDGYDLFVINTDGTSGQRLLDVRGAEDIEWSSDSSRITVDCGSFIGYRDCFYEVDLDSGKGIRLEGGVINYRWSVDDDQVASTRGSYPWSAGVFLENSDGADRRAISDEQTFSVIVGWSPANLSFVYSSGSDSWSEDVDLFLVSAEGDVRQLTDDEHRNQFRGWSADGTSIFYSNATGLFRIDADGSDSVSLSDEAINRFRQSPDGALIAFSNSQGVFIAATHAVSPQMVSSPSEITPIFGGWSPDGSHRLLYLSDGELFAYNVDTDAHVQLTSDSKSMILGGWSPDGSRVLYLSDGEYFAVDPDGSNGVQLTSDGKSKIFAAWSPSGGRIAYYAGARAEDTPFDPQLVVVDTATGGDPIATVSLTFVQPRDARYCPHSFEATTDWGQSGIYGEVLGLVSDPNCGG